MYFMTQDEAIFSFIVHATKAMSTKPYINK